MSGVIRRLAAVCFAALALAPAPASAPAPSTATPDVDALMRRLDDLYRSDASIAKVRMTTTAGGKERTLTLTAWMHGEDEALIVIDSPEREAGIATLKVGTSLWNHFPRISRTMRIPPSMMLGSWMGSDFTNDDLVHESTFRDDYVSRVDGRTDDPPGWRVVSEAKPGVVGLWQKVVWSVSDDLLPGHVEFYDRRGRLSRTIDYEDVREIGGRRLPTRMVLVPVGDEKRRTELEYLDLDFAAKVPEDTFSLSRLERGR